MTIPQYRHELTYSIPRNPGGWQGGEPTGEHEAAQALPNPLPWCGEPGSLRWQRPGPIGTPESAAEWLPGAQGLPGPSTGPLGGGLRLSGFENKMGRGPHSPA
jgi:hypothetical protein